MKGLLEEASKRHKKIQKLLLKWALKNLRDFSWRRNRTPYRVMVAEFLLKRTTSTAVSRVYEAFLERYPSVKELARADVRKLENLLETIGYYRLRARAMKETANYIVEKFDGEIPKDLEHLLSIPNIGPYTAGAILSLGYSQPAPMVDSNVERILKRIFKNTLPEKGVLKRLQEVAEFMVPKDKHDIFNLALLDLGALICTYREPYCDKCAINLLCDTGRENLGYKS
jgi:A/G-specific adenine glycosylase